MTASEADYVRELRELEAYLNLEFSLVRGKLASAAAARREVRAPATARPRRQGPRLPGTAAFSLARDGRAGVPCTRQRRLIQSVAAEARALARFRHPRSSTSTASSTRSSAARRPLCAGAVEMELLERGTLRGLAQAAAPPHEILAVFAGVGDGLAAAHEQEPVALRLQAGQRGVRRRRSARAWSTSASRARAPKVTGPPAAPTLIGTPALRRPRELRRGRQRAQRPVLLRGLAWQALFGSFPYDETAADLRSRKTSAIRHRGSICPHRCSRALPRCWQKSQRHIVTPTCARSRCVRCDRPRRRPRGDNDVGPSPTSAPITRSAPARPGRPCSAWSCSPPSPGAASVRHFELDLGWLDWSRPAAA